MNKIYMLGHLLAISLVLVTRANGEDGDDLPQIWNSSDSLPSYQKLYQLQMNDEARQRVMIEEWGSVTDRLFRLDLITGEQRSTYLSNGETGEVFRYKPFVCDKLSPKSDELSAIFNLFQGYSTDRGKPVLVYGLGPLWLKAKSSLGSVKRIPGVMEMDSLKGLIGFEATFGETAAALNYVARFYFKDEKQDTLLAVEWIRPNEGSEGKNILLARAMLISIDTKPIEHSIFQLPMGYGCERTDEYELGDPSDLSVKLHPEGSLQQATVEVTLSRAITGNRANNNKWEFKRHTIRSMRATLRSELSSRSYYVTKDEMRDATTFKLKHYKRVWSSLEGADNSRVYVIDESTGACQLEEMALNDLIQITFPGSGDHETGNAGASIGLDLIEGLFEDSTDYHLIRESIEPVGDHSRQKTSLYEKRVDKTGLKGLLTGPASIVKKIRKLKSKELKWDQAAVHMSISVFFYSDDLERIRDKLVINLIELDQVGMNYMHKMLDISPCFAGNTTNAQLARKQALTIKYPLESPQLAEALNEAQDEVKELILANLIDTTPIEPLQISNVELTIDNFYMYFKLELLDLPLTETYGLRRGMELTGRRLEPKDFLQKIASSLDKCASSCAHYNCARFSYNSRTLSCRLELAAGAGELVDSASSSLYSNYGQRMPATSVWKRKLSSAMANKVHLKPSLIFAALKELIDLGESSLDNTVPMVITMKRSLLLGPGAKPLGGDDDDGLLELRPISIHSDMDLMGVIVDTSRLYESDLHVEYSVLFENYDFDGGPTIELLEDVNYDDCAQYCEDNDCRSFAYCEAQRTCRMSSLHMSKDVKASAIKKTSCRIFALDSLSKFEHFGVVAPPAKAAKVHGGDKKPGDCASLCMEETSFACQGFYYCKNMDNDITCLMQDKHIDQGLLEDAALAGGDDDRSSNQQCHLYSRSYLSHFNDYYGKAIRTDGKGYEKLVGEGAEACASRCIHSSCLAFHVCHEPQLECLVPAASAIKSDPLVAREHCTTFVLSDKSQFNLMKKKLILDKPDKSSSVQVAPGVVSELIGLDKEGERALEEDANRGVLDIFSKLKNSKTFEPSHWLLPLIFGGLIGSCCVLIWKNYDFLYTFATDTFDRVRR